MTQTSTQRFIELLHSVPRQGIYELRNWLVKDTDFLKAPASSQYHGAKEGDLVEHSLAVYDELCRLLEWKGIKCLAESAVIIALFHDICKANFYTIEMRNRKNEETGQWEKYPFYKIEDQFPCGHGEKSVIILQNFIRLTGEEIMAIRWHMGAWGNSDYATMKSMSSAMERYPLILALQMADQMATFWDEK